MKAIQIKSYGGAEKLEQVDIADPQPGAGQVVVRIVATTFNLVDPKRTSGTMKEVFPLEFPFIPGGDFSGVIASIGKDVTGFQQGEEVYGMSLAGGTYAELIAIDADKIAPKPKNVDHLEAASLVGVAQTALQMLDRAAVHKGKTVLIHGAGGGVGSVAVQVAHQRGAIVIATASAASLNRVRDNGADQVIDYAAARFENSVKDVDAVLDTVGGEVQTRSYGVLKAGGTLVAISQPPSQEEAAKHHVIASMLLTESTGASLRELARLIDAGKIKPHIGKVYPLSGAARAWRDKSTTQIEGRIIFTNDAVRSGRL